MKNKEVRTSINKKEKTRSMLAFYISPVIGNKKVANLILASVTLSVILNKISKKQQIKTVL